MYGKNNIEGIRKFMVDEKQTLSVAESVTSGHLQVALSLAEGATGFFQGGITTYNLGQKARHLKVNPIHAEGCNSVSEKITDEMALHAIDLFSSDWSIAITGYASPVPELDINELFAHYSIAFKKLIVLRKKIRSIKQSPFDVQVEYTEIILKDFNEFLQSNVHRNNHLMPVQV
jgi:nicotinamide-nucleotide amidase